MEAVTVESTLWAAHIEDTESSALGFCMIVGTKLAKSLAAALGSDEPSSVSWGDGERRDGSGAGLDLEGGLSYGFRRLMLR
jgi:hypothetical protein